MAQSLDHHAMHETGQRATDLCVIPISASDLGRFRLDDELSRRS